MSTRAMACCAMLVCAAAVLAGAPVRANDSAHAVADKFASEPDRSALDKREAERKAEDARKREAEIKADKAREEAAARRAAEALKADKEKADKAKRAKAAPAEAARLAAERRKTEEAEMLARARREAEEIQAAEEARILAEQEAAIQRAQAELLASQKAEQERAKADAAREARTKPAQPDASEADAQRALRALIAWTQRAAATRRVVHSLSRVRQIREARLAAAEARRVVAAARQPVNEPPRPSIAGDNHPATVTDSTLDTTAAHVGAKSPRMPEPARTAKAEPAGADLRGAADPKPEGRPDAKPDMREARTDPARDMKPDTVREAGLRERTVTVLLVMAPGTYGIRRNGPKVADPVLCTLDGCYIGMGAGTPAQFKPGRKALGFGNTVGMRAGACRQQLGCIFRGVELGQVPGYLQPVDLHILKHDRRRGQVINTDSDCRIDAGRVSCRSGIYAEDYAMWVIPESMAAKAGADALDRALEEGLAAPRSADLHPRQMR